MSKSRWGFHACSFAEFSKLRALWKAVLLRRRQVAAWKRWNAKAPHNRVTRERIRDPAGRVVGCTVGQPAPEPPLPVVACRKLTRPSGKVDVELSGPSGQDLRRLQESYRLARRPRATAAEVEPLPVTKEELAAWTTAISR